MLPAGAQVYFPRGAALDVMRCRDDEVMLDGPAGTGKSRVLLEKMNALAEKYPGCRLAIVRKARASITETALVTFEEHVKPTGCDVRNQQRRVRQSYEYRNGSEILVAGIDNPVKLMSAEFDVIYVQEATELTLNDWEFLSTRLRNGVIPYQQLLGDCNPGPPTHWLKKRMDAGLTTRIVSRHEDNPRLYTPQGDMTPFGQTYLARLDKLTGPRKERLRYGRWAAAEGMVFEAWDDAIHLIPPEQVPPMAAHFVVIDFGFTNPLVCQLWGRDGDGRLYRLREIYRTRRTVREHAPQIAEMTRGLDIEAWICDHDAEDRATLEQELSITTQAAYKGVSTGIQAVNDRLAVQEDGRPRLFLVRGALLERDPLMADPVTGVSDRPTCTEEEIDGYVWAKSPGEAGKKDSETLKEQPVKKNDHGMDALRYAVAYADGLGKQAWTFWAESI